MANQCSIYVSLVARPGGLIAAVRSNDATAAARVATVIAGALPVAAPEAQASGVGVEAWGCRFLALPKIGRLGRHKLSSPPQEQPLCPPQE